MVRRKTDVENKRFLKYFKLCYKCGPLCEALRLSEPKSHICKIKIQN